MFELSIKSEIGSAHFLKGYEGKCSRLHGHNWKIEVIIIGDCLDSVGMVADFSVLKKQLNGFLLDMDHVCLNELPFFRKVNPTTENIAKYIYGNYAKVVSPLKVKNVRVWESDNSSVTYYE